VADAGVTDSAMNGAWRFAKFTPLDLGRVWAALVRGDLLGEELTAYTLALASGPDIPDGYETLPDRDFEHERLRYGQKAGYYVSDGVPYYFVGAGYLIDEVTGQAFVPVLFAYTNNPELLDPVRRRVFPIVVEHVETVLEAG